MKGLAGNERQQASKKPGEQSSGQSDELKSSSEFTTNSSSRTPEPAHDASFSARFREEVLAPEASSTTTFGSSLKMRSNSSKGTEFFSQIEPESVASGSAKARRKAAAAYPTRAAKLVQNAHLQNASATMWQQRAQHNEIEREHEKMTEEGSALDGTIRARNALPADCRQRANSSSSSFFSRSSRSSSSAAAVPSTSKAADPTAATSTHAATPARTAPPQQATFHALGPIATPAAATPAEPGNSGNWSATRSAQPAAAGYVGRAMQPSGRRILAKSTAFAAASAPALAKSLRSKSSSSSSSAFLIHNSKPTETSTLTSKSVSQLNAKTTTTTTKKYPQPEKSNNNNNPVTKRLTTTTTGSTKNPLKSSSIIKQVESSSSQKLQSPAIKAASPLLNLTEEALNYKHPINKSKLKAHSKAISLPHSIIIKKRSKMTDQAILDKLEAGYTKLQAATPEQCHSLLKKYLTREVLDKLKTRKTAMGATLLDVAQSGFDNLDSGIGIYAPDAESYTLFSELFNPIIEDYHGGFKATDKHPASDFGDLDSFVNVDPTNEYVISTRVRCGRSLQGYPFNPCLSEAQYKEMEDKVSSALKGMDGDLAGTYYPLTGMTKDTQKQLIDDHFLFKEGDRFLQCANACRYWPTGRGIFHNEAKTFLVWVNEEDHLRIISMQKGGDLKTIFSRLVKGVRSIEAKVPFSRDDRLGFLTFCPTNLGTTIRASVHIKLPKLAADRKKLEEVAGKFNLQVRGTSGEHTESVGGVYDISNKRRLGLTEYQAVREMQDGILELIKIEKSL